MFLSILNIAYKNFFRKFVSYDNNVTVASIYIPYSLKKSVGISSSFHLINCYTEKKRQLLFLWYNKSTEKKIFTEYKSIIYNNRKYKFSF